jgi:hypothetical protein
MGKRLSLSDYLFTLLFIVMLAGGVGAFFYGVEVGKGQSAAKYEKLLSEKKAENHEFPAYHQQYLVSFYHTVFLPYREFQKVWFEAEEALAAGRAADAKSVMANVARAAEREYEAMDSAALFPEHSGLLTDAHTKYLQSLKLFSNAAKKFDAAGRNGSELLAAVEADAYFREAMQFGLDAQRDFFTAISLWHESVDPSVKTDAVKREKLSFDDWNALGVNHKNRYVAGWLARAGKFGNFYPQDLTLRIDEMIAQGNAAKMNLDDISEVAATLVDTRAVRFGDFVSGKHLYYGNSPFPQLPFFFASN